MKRNLKVAILQALVVLLFASLYLYNNLDGSSVHRFVTGAQSCFSFSNSSTTTGKYRNRNDSEVYLDLRLGRTDVSKLHRHPELAIVHKRLLDETAVSVGPRKSSLRTSLGDAAPSVYIEEMPQEFYHTDEGVDLRNSSLKKILIWNEGYGSKTMGFGFGQAPFKLARCEVDTCIVTGNRTLVPFIDIDAIIFHFRTTNPRDMPRMRYDRQRWIFEEVESSSYIYQDIRIYNGVFNWTMTYRRDSDIVYTYGRVYANETQNLSSRRENYAAGKTKMAAWFVSNCRSHSRREKFVKALQMHFHVDIFGKCGPKQCPHKYGQKCYKLLEANYKFYLSFENSVCKDYVTEKLFNILKYNIVPVVYGLADYDKIAPPGSYINALKFPDVRSLAEYLKYLDGNDTAYNDYFRWKGQYTVDTGWSNTAQPFCELCKKLHEDQAPKVYEDMKAWFVTKGSCKTLKIKDWLKNLK